MTECAPCLPGVWHRSFGQPAGITPVSLRELPPASAALAAMPACTEPAWWTAATWRRSRRGLVVTIPVGDDEQFYGLGLQLKSVAQRGKKKTLRVNSDPVADTGDSHAPVPFLCSTAGWGLLVDTARYATFHVACIQPTTEIAPAEGRIGGSTGELYAARHGGKRSVVIEVPHEDGVDIYAFGGPTLREAVARYNLFSGGGCRPGLATLGVWYRAYGKATAADCEALLDGIRADGIPCDVFGLEPGWQTSAYPCSFVWSDERFPDHRAFLERMHRRGVQVNCWEHAFTSPVSPLAPALRAHAGPSVVMGGLVPDLLQAPARQVLTDHHQTLVEEGIDGFKLDECDGSDFIASPWSFPETDEFPSGLDGECMHSLFGIAYQRTIDAVYRRRGVRTLHSVRNSHALAAPYPFVLYSDLYDLRDFVRGVASASFSGLLWSPEVRDAASPEELVRRVQAVALSPQALINAWYIAMPPWRQIAIEPNLRGEVMSGHAATTAHVRAALQLRMRLLPYLDAAFARYAATGVPPCRALAMDFPADAACRACEDQWLLGEDLLVAPVLSGTARQVVLPPGRWRPLAGGPAVAGPATIAIDAPLDLLPVYVRDGALLPLAEPLTHVAADAAFPITVEVHGDGRYGSDLVEDDGRTLGGPANRVRLSWDGRAVNLERHGDWPGRRFRCVGMVHRVD
jgi:alpha-D-xyloside xylohydrolase